MSLTHTHTHSHTCNPLSTHTHTHNPCNPLCIHTYTHDATRFVHTHTHNTQHMQPILYTHIHTTHNTCNPPCIHTYTQRVQPTCTQHAQPALYTHTQHMQPAYSGTSASIDICPFFSEGPMEYYRWSLPAIRTSATTIAVPEYRFYVNLVFSHYHILSPTAPNFVPEQVQITIARCWRQYQARKTLTLQRHAASILVKWWRAHISARSESRRCHAVRIITRWWGARRGERASGRILDWWRHWHNRRVRLRLHVAMIEQTWTTYRSKRDAKRILQRSLQLTQWRQTRREQYLQTFYQRYRMMGAAKTKKSKREAATAAMKNMFTAWSEYASHGRRRKVRHMIHRWRQRRTDRLLKVIIVDRNCSIFLWRLIDMMFAYLDTFIPPHLAKLMAKEKQTYLMLIRGPKKHTMSWLTVMDSVRLNTATIHKNIKQIIEADSRLKHLHFGAKMLLSLGDTLLRIRKNVHIVLVHGSCEAVLQTCYGSEVVITDRLMHDWHNGSTAPPFLLFLQFKHVYMDVSDWLENGSDLYAVLKQKGCDRFEALL